MTNQNTLKFEEIVLKHEKRIYNILLALCHNVDEAKDLAQETFIRAFKNTRSLRDESRVGAWLYRIAINCWKNRIRYNKRRGIPVTISLDSLPEECRLLVDRLKKNDASLEECPANENLYSRILVEVHNLKHKYKVAMVLYLKNHTYEEIAEVLKCRVGTAKSLVSRAKEKIKRNILPHL